MAVQIAFAYEGIRPDLEIVDRLGYVSVEADRYEEVMVSLRQTDFQYPGANWVIEVRMSRSYDRWTATGVAVVLGSREQPV